MQFDSGLVNRYLQYIPISLIYSDLFKIYVSLELRELQHLEGTPVAVHILVNLNVLILEISGINPGT